MQEQHNPQKDDLGYFLARHSSSEGESGVWKSEERDSGNRLGYENGE